MSSNNQRETNKRRNARNRNTVDGQHLVAPPSTSISSWPSVISIIRNYMPLLQGFLSMEQSQESSISSTEQSCGSPRRLDLESSPHEEANEETLSEALSETLFQCVQPVVPTATATSARPLLRDRTASSAVLTRESALTTGSHRQERPHPTQRSQLHELRREAPPTMHGRNFFGLPRSQPSQQQQQQQEQAETSQPACGRRGLFRGLQPMQSWRDILPTIFSSEPFIDWPPAEPRMQEQAAAVPVEHGLEQRFFLDQPPAEPTPQRQPAVVPEARQRRHNDIPPAEPWPQHPPETPP